MAGFVGPVVREERPIAVFVGADDETGGGHASIGDGNGLFLTGSRRGNGDQQHVVCMGEAEGSAAAGNLRYGHPSAGRVVSRIDEIESQCGDAVGQELRHDRGRRRQAVVGIVQREIEDIPFDIDMRVLGIVVDRREDGDCEHGKQRANHGGLLDGPKLKEVES